MVLPSMQSPLWHWGCCQRGSLAEDSLEFGSGAELGFKKNPKYFPVLVACPGLGLSNKVRHIS